MPAESEQSQSVPWEEVAAYIVAVETTAPEHGPDFHRELRRWSATSPEDLRLALARLESNRAAQRLSSPTWQYSWTLRTRELGSLWFRPYREPGRHRTIREFVETDWPEMSDEQRMASSFGEGEVRAEVCTLVTHQEDKGRWYLGDGYHRAIALFMAGCRDVTVYAGEFV